MIEWEGLVPNTPFSITRTSYVLDVFILSPLGLWYFFFPWSLLTRPGPVHLLDGRTIYPLVGCRHQDCANFKAWLSLDVPLKSSPFCRRFQPGYWWGLKPHSNQLVYTSWMDYDTLLAHKPLFHSYLGLCLMFIYDDVMFWFGTYVRRRYYNYFIPFGWCY